VAEQSDSPVAARAELDQRQQGPEGDAEGALKQDAKQQEQAQSAQLAAGRAKGAARKAAAADRRAARQGNVAVLRDGEVGSGPVRGRVDNMTRRDDTDVNEGHFCYIDYGNAEAKKMVLSQLAPKGSALAQQGFEPGVGSADYGVYLQAGGLDETGYPVTAVVLLRDEHAAQVVVPYDAISPAPARGR
jgi:hypothetical protein